MNKRKLNKWFVAMIILTMIISQMGLSFAAKPVSPPQTESALDITSQNMAFELTETESVNFSVNATYKTDMVVNWSPIVSSDGLLTNQQVVKSQKVVRKTTTYYEEAKYLFVPEDIESVTTYTYTLSATSTTNAKDTDQITVTFTVSPTEVEPTNRAPVANDDVYTVNLGSTLVMEPLINDSDPDGDVLTLLNVSGVENISFDSSTITFTPQSSQLGEILLNYVVTDGEFSDEGSIKINVTQIVVPETFVYVALGDSIPSGVSYEDSLFQKIIDSYSDKLAKYYSDRNANFYYHDFAVSGFNAIDVYNQLDASSVQIAIQDANVITLCVGANDIMDAAKRKWTGAIDFYNINWATADTGRKAFEYYWPRIVLKIQELNPDVKLMVTTIYNPYNKNDAKTYNKVSGQDTSLLIHDQVDLYLWNDAPLKQGLNTIITNFGQTNALTLNYTVVDVHNHFETNYENTKGDVTAFYGNWVQDPHPDPNGQMVIFNLHLLH